MKTKKSTKMKSFTKKSNTKKLNTKKLQKIPSINILSYNISWESMSGNVKKWALCNNNTDINNPKHYSVCVNNISNVFDNDNNNLDFITLQEATDYKKLIKESSKLKTMNYEIHKSGLDVLVTFWNNSMYKLKYKILGEFEEGRPWMATIFKKNTNTYKIYNTHNTHNTSDLCLVNVHMGHYSKEEEFHMMNNMMIEIQNGIEKKEKKEKQTIKANKKSNMRYIISGDFNYDIKKFGDARNSFELNNTKFYLNPKHILTCCINRNRHNDHVIDSLKSPINISIPKVDYMASDHKPILVFC